jgi:flagella basal body P-ring formation protein FlgA
VGKITSALLGNFTSALTIESDLRRRPDDGRNRTGALMLRVACALALMAPPVFAETLVANRTIRAETILAPSDLVVIQREIPGMLRSKEEAIGMETRVALYSGRPIHPEDIGPPAIIDRNQIVTLRYQRGGLVIATDARALSRAGVGDVVRVMNLASRSTVSGVVLNDGTVRVGGPDIAAIN